MSEAKLLFLRWSLLLRQWTGWMGQTGFCKILRFSAKICASQIGRWQKGWFPKGWFWRMFPRNENRNEGTFGWFPGTKTGTRVCSHVLPEQKPERGHIRQNNPLTKPPFYLPVTKCCTFQRKRISTRKNCKFSLAVPGVLWKKATKTTRAMRGNALASSAQTASSEYCQRSTFKQRELWEQNRL